MGNLATKLQYSPFPLDDSRFYTAWNDGFPKNFARISPYGEYVLIGPAQDVVSSDDGPTISVVGHHVGVVNLIDGLSRVGWAMTITTSGEQKNQPAVAKPR